MPETYQYRHIRPDRRRGARGLTVLVLLAAVAAAAALVYVLFLRDTGPTARESLQAFTRTWSRGDDASAARDTTDAAVAAKALRANRRGLDGAKLRASVLSVHEDGDRARGRVRLSWQGPPVRRLAHDTDPPPPQDGKAGGAGGWGPAT